MCLVFKWSKVVRSRKGLVFKCHLNTVLNLVWYLDSHLNNGHLEPALVAEQSNVQRNSCQLLYRGKHVGQSINIYIRKQDDQYLSGIQMVRLSGIQMSIKYQTIWHPTSYQPVEYQTSLVFRSPMYSDSMCTF